MRFVLVHGGFHGAWCFDDLTRELVGRGHAAVAPDLPGHGGRLAEKATMDAYRDAVVEVLHDGDIVVGHSMGGYVMSVAADAFGPGLGHLIYLAGGVPVEGESMGQTHSVDVAGTSRHYVVREGPNGPEMEFPSYDGAREHFFHDCDDATVQRAFDQLTPQQIQPTLDPIHMTTFWEFDTPRSYIVCLDDRSGTNHYIEGFLKRLKLSQAYPIVASHSPFLSRPSDTAELLIEIAAQA